MGSWASQPCSPSSLPPLPPPTKTCCCRCHLRGLKILWDTRSLPLPDRLRFLLHFGTASPCAHFGDSGQMPACSAGAKKRYEAMPAHHCEMGELKVGFSNRTCLRGSSPLVWSGSGPLLPQCSCGWMLSPEKSALRWSDLPWGRARRRWGRGPDVAPQLMHPSA